MYLKDTTGNRSMTATIAFIAFGVVMLKVLLNDVTVGSIDFGSIDSLAIAAVLTPTLGAYTARRWGQPAPSAPPQETADNGLGGPP